ncbi:MAG: hypothetical protein HZC48_09460 [Nitrospirae bacterium]|nr:hypothetical protein [Nitrospirota bacterium]
MLNKDNNNNQYIEGNSRVQLALFAFLCICSLIGFLLKQIAEEKIEQLNTVTNTTAALSELNNIFVNFLIIPLSIFCTIQGIYLLRLGMKTIRAGVHPPPGVRMPFRAKIQTGVAAKLSAIGYFFAAVCGFIVIALLLKMRHEIFRHI